MTFRVNDMFLYGVHGVCTIVEIAERNFGGEPMEYYILKPIYENNSTIFVAVNNESLIAKMRRILSPEEIYALIKAMPEENTIWIEHDNIRREQYKQILSGGDRTELVRLIKTLYLHQQAQKGKGKKLLATDDRFMKEAEKMLYDEFAHVLNIERDQVLPFILEQIRIEKKVQ